MKSKLLIFIGIVGMAFSFAISIAPPAQALACGDPGFIGPCVDYKIIDCTKITSPTEKQHCDAMQGCVNKGLALANCEATWTSCIASYGSNTIDYASCTTAIAGGNLAAAKAPTNVDAGKTNCTSMDGLGWIICPVLSIVAKVTDAAYSSVSYMLTIPSMGLNTPGGKDLYKAWSIMRNFANGAFVVAFMIVIYSQLTGAGINNYGIKKLLPRIVIAAILVNVSFWICLIAVDVSNIIGTSIKSVFDGIQGQLYVPPTTTNTVGGIATTSTFGALTALALVADATLIYSMLAFLMPVALTALAAVVATIVVLTMRDGFIVILIVASPLAFVAYLLPNTQSWFGKWKDLFKLLLIMFPIVSFVFGGSALASSILSSVGAGGSGLTPFLMQVMAAGVRVIPLVVVPTIVQTATGILGKYAGYINDPSKGAFDRMRNRAKEFKDNNNEQRKTNALTGVRTFGGSGIRRRHDRTLKKSELESASSAAEASYNATNSGAAQRVANILANQQSVNAANAARTTTYARNVANGLITPGQGLSAAAQADPAIAQALAAQQAKAIADAIRDTELSADIKPGAAGIEEMGKTMRQAIIDGDSITARAMQNMLLRSGSPGIAQYRNVMTDLDDEVDHTKTSVPASSTMEAMRDNITQNNSGIKAAAADIMAHATNGAGTTMASASASPKTWNMSDADLVQQKTSSIKLAIEHGAVDQQRAQTIVKDARLIDKLEPQMREIMQQIANATPQGPPPKP